MALPEDEINQDPIQDPVQEPVDESIDDGGDMKQDQVEQEAETLSAEQALAVALEEVEKFKDLALRAQAEVQNIQRRSQRDVENAHKFGIERFLQNLIPVVDGIEKAVEACEQANSDGQADDPIAEGVKLCRKLLVDVLGKEGIEEIEPVGEPFDPKEHQAMVMVENPDMEPNSVFAVAQKGYKLNGRLVRPAMVMVTKAPAASN